MAINFPIYMTHALKLKANFVFLKNFTTNNLIVFNRIESWFPFLFSYAGRPDCIFPIVSYIYQRVLKGGMIYCVKLNIQVNLYYKTCNIASNHDVEKLTKVTRVKFQNPKKSNSILLCMWSSPLLISKLITRSWLRGWVWMELSLFFNHVQTKSFCFIEKIQSRSQIRLAVHHWEIGKQLFHIDLIGISNR